MHDASTAGKCMPFSFFSCPVHSFTAGEGGGVRGGVSGGGHSNIRFSMV